VLNAVPRLINLIEHLIDLLFTQVLLLIQELHQRITVKGVSCVPESTRFLLQVI